MRRRKRRVVSRRRRTQKPKQTKQKVEDIFVFL
jgi:hypothetical protein